MQVKYKRVHHTVPHPKYHTAGAAGFDLVACCDKVCIPPGGIYTFYTGLCFEIPNGYEGEVRPRSGLATKHGITIINAPGTIDSDYRGEVRVTLVNHNDIQYWVKPFDRIAQMLIKPVVQAELKEWEDLSFTERGRGGHGSTGE